jgi:endo-1,3(4)-beta-glucanase
MHTFLIVTTIITIIVDANIFKPVGTAYPAGCEVHGCSRIQPTWQQETLLPPINVKDGIIYKRAIPTNDWWSNMIARDDVLVLKPIFAEPYRIEVQSHEAPFGIRIAYPFATRFFGPQNNNNAAQYYAHALGIQHIGFSSSNFQLPKMEVTHWDDMGVHMVMKDTEGRMESDFVRGMAFVSANYTNLTPVVMTDHAIIEFKRVHTRKVLIQLNNNQKWVLYADKDIEFTQQGQQLIGDRRFTGVLRVALLTSDTIEDENQYDPYAACHVVGGTVHAKNNLGYRIVWKTKGVCEHGLLHFALIHHLDSLEANSFEFTHTTNTNMALNSATHGPMKGIVVAKEWKFTEPEDVNIDFFPPRSPSAEHVTNYKMLELLKEEIRAAWNLQQDGSYYFNGKAAQKYASLCLMASDRAIVGNDNQALKNECVGKLQAIYTHYLENSWTYPLVYDEVYRGLSSSEGFKWNDPWRDFGNSAFNDHHYHYGYWITASAMLKYLDPSWSRMQELDDMVNLMIRDTANPSTQDRWFPRFRNFDWFVGHSYSHGVSPFADGKDQESTSEEVNFHYGLMLWGKASVNTKIEEMGKLMLKVNIRAINHYFLMTDDNAVHPKEIIPNKVTGIFFDNKVDYATWFGPNREYIHGIQMIPVSPIHELYRKKEFVSQEWEQVLCTIDIIKDPLAQSPWQSLIFANAATVNQTLALNKLSTVPMDDGLSRSWALYYAATRPQHNESIQTSSQKTIVQPPKNDGE